MTSQDYFSLNEEQISRIKKFNPEINIDHVAYQISKNIDSKQITKEAIDSAVEQYCEQNRQLN